MKHLIEGPDKVVADDVAESRHDGAAVTELSDTELTRVAGGVTCWMKGTSAGSGTGLYPHSGYPPSE